MATTLNLQNTINWARPLLKNQPLDVSNMEPALTTGNMILQTIVGAPFRWPWNRSTLSFATEKATPRKTDYAVELPDFGFLEDAWAEDANGKTMPLSIAMSLPKPSNEESRPTSIAVQNDDNQGTLTFRTKEAPNAAYNIGATYQKKAPRMVSLGSTWGPVPDEVAFVFDWGFLTISSLLVNDVRFAIWEKYFIGKLLGLQGGLDEQSRNIFLGNWLEMTRTIQRSGAFVQQGTNGRGN